MNKRLLTPTEIKNADYIYDILKKDKKSFVAKYGKDAEKIMRGRAIKNAKKKTEQMHKDKIKEMVKSSLQTPPKINAKEYLLQRENKINPSDVVKMDIPLFIHMLEYAREDASTDINLHDVAEKATSLSANGKTLTMADYANLVKGEMEEGLPKGYFKKEFGIGGHKKQMEENITDPQEETEMSHSQLVSIQSSVEDLMKKIDSGEQLDPWVLSKLTIAQDYLETIDDYLKGKPLNEKHLTLAEKKKKEEIVKAMKKTFKGPKPAMYAIATKKAEKVAEDKIDETFGQLVSKLKKQGKSGKAATKIAGAVAAAKAHGAGKGPSTKQKARLTEKIISKLKDNND